VHYFWFNLSSPWQVRIDFEQCSSAQISVIISFSDVGLPLSALIDQDSATPDRTCRAEPHDQREPE
jgi:hypothetical protein